MVYLVLIVRAPQWLIYVISELVGYLSANMDWEEGRLFMKQKRFQT